MPQTYAYFFVDNFACDPALISALLDLVPTKTWRQGDAWLPKKTRPHSRWLIHSTADRAEIHLDTHVQSVLDIIQPRKEQILELHEQGYALGINCVGYYYDEHPGIGLSVEQINCLSALRLPIDFDFYCLYETDDRSIETLENNGS